MSFLTWSIAAVAAFVLTGCATSTNDVAAKSAQTSIVYHDAPTVTGDSLRIHVHTVPMQCIVRVHSRHDADQLPAVLSPGGGYNPLEYRERPDWASTYLLSPTRAKTPFGEPAVCELVYFFPSPQQINETLVITRRPAVLTSTQETTP